jgi:hypothetical protein
MASSKSGKIVIFWGLFLLLSLVSGLLSNPPFGRPEDQPRINELDSERSLLKKEIDAIECPSFFDAPLGNKSCAREQEEKAALKVLLENAETEEDELKHPVPTPEPCKTVWSNWKDTFVNSCDK